MMKNVVLCGCPDLSDRHLLQAVFGARIQKGISALAGSHGPRVETPSRSNLKFDSPLMTRGKIYSNIVETVGHTPLVRLNRIPASAGIDPSTTIALKCEFFNPLGSVKTGSAWR